MVDVRTGDVRRKVCELRDLQVEVSAKILASQTISEAQEILESVRTV